MKSSSTGSGCSPRRTQGATPSSSKRSGFPGKCARTFAATCYLFAAQAHSAELTGQVVSISDGDTLTLLVDQRQIKVRLADIDAPEAKQPWGTRSRQSLGSLCHGKPATAEPVSQDRYGRTVARVACAGRDAAAHQVSAGMAWVFPRYAPADSPLCPLESEARAARRGLWADPSPVPPWEWRRRP